MILIIRLRDLHSQWVQNDLMTISAHTGNSKLPPKWNIRRQNQCKVINAFSNLKKKNQAIAFDSVRQHIFGSDEIAGVC